MLACKSNSGTNAAVVVALPIAQDVRRRAFQLIWSYSGDPTGGRCFSTNCEGEELDFQITKGGPGALALPPAYGRLGKALTFTLAAGGAGITGTLSVLYGYD